MDRFFKDFIRNLLTIRHLPKKLVARRDKIVLTYLHLSLKLIIIDWLLGQKITNETVFGYHMKFLNYFHFVRLFEETYLRNEYFFQAKNDHPLIIDAGSNMDTPIYFKWLYSNAKIIAFEANPVTFGLLKQNILTNKLIGIQLHNVALLDKEKSIDFFSNKNDRGTGLASVYKSSAANRHEVRFSQRVITKKLSTFIDKPIDFLKIDIEGAENAVFTELDQSKKIKLIKQMAIEYHHHQVKGDFLGKFLSILEKNGFEYQISAGLKIPTEFSVFQDLLIVARLKKQ